MKLTDTAEFQKSDEELFGDPEITLSFRTRDEEADELIEREYTFAHAKEWDKWTFSRYKERRCSADVKIHERNWRESESLTYDDSRRLDIDIPQTVIDKLDNMVSADVIRLQL